MASASKKRKKDRTANIDNESNLSADSMTGYMFTIFYHIFIILLNVYYLLYIFIYYILIIFLLYIIKISLFVLYRRN